MIDVRGVQAMLREQGLDHWADVISDPLQRFLVDSPHGDWDSWRQAMTELPQLGEGDVGSDDGAWTLSPTTPVSNATTDTLRTALMKMHPWRKGPYRIGKLTIDTEWRSDWKWDRVEPFVEPLQDRLVLDVGCGNGYHCWRIAEGGARQVIGIDPTAVFLAQFLAIRQLMAPLQPGLGTRVILLPLGIENVPRDLAAFDTVFSMGVLYHRRSPIDHLLELRSALRAGGQLVLETLVVDGHDDKVLVPNGRYAKMRNVWFIPTTAMLENWLSRTGFSNVRTVDATTTTVEEQRSTSWMTFESLADFLDPADSRFTIEGYPAPCRAVLVANA